MFTIVFILYKKKIDIVTATIPVVLLTSILKHQIFSMFVFYKPDMTIVRDQEVVS